MPFDFTVSFDPKPIEKQLEERFGEGSDAQYRWSEIVFSGSQKYMPLVTGTFINQSYILSEPLFDKGELLYPAPHAHFLWEGVKYVDPITKAAGFLTEDGWKSRKGVTKEKTDEPLDFNKEANPNAGPRWTERAANDLYDTWVNTMQGLIDKGDV